MIQRIIKKVFGWGGTFAAMFLILAIWLSEIYGGKIDGRYFPVVTDVSITSAVPVGDTRSQVAGEFFKVRGDCSFEAIKFFLGVPFDGVRVDLEIVEGAKERVGGWEDFGPWIVQLDKGQLSGRSYAIVYHRCHPFWLTETLFYEGTK